MSLAPPKNSIPLSSVPRGWVTIAALCLTMAAVAGAALGISRSLGAHDLPSDAGELAPVPNTTLAKALPADTIFDESRIRSIAREEAQAALARTAPKPRAAPKDDADAADAGETADASPATPSLSKPSSLTVVKPASPSARPSSVTSSSSSAAAPRSPATPNPYPSALTPN